MRAIWLAACGIGQTVLFRLNSGMAWASGGGRVSRLPDGSVVVPHARPMTLGFGLTSNKPVAGAGDLIGWHSIVVTPEMVGCRVAIFASVECKRTQRGVTSADQVHWQQQVQQAGGIAVIANSPSVAQAALRDYRPPKA